MTLPFPVPTVLFPVEHRFLDLDARWVDRSRRGKGAMTLPFPVPTVLFPVKHRFLDLDARWVERMKSSIAFEEQWTHERILI